jgi:hypothetical protein
MYETLDQRYMLGSLLVERIYENKIAVKTGALMAEMIANHLKIFFFILLTILFPLGIIINLYPLRWTNY